MLFQIAGSDESLLLKIITTNDGLPVFIKEAKSIPQPEKEIDDPDLIFQFMCSIYTICSMVTGIAKID